MSDHAITSRSIDDLMVKLNKHIENVLREKYERVINLEKIKNESVEKGRDYIEAYVDYTHSIEGIHDIIKNTEERHQKHKH